MGNSLLPTMTERRKSWLMRLRDSGPQRRFGGPEGCHCARLGWTELADKTAYDWIEQITPAGLDALKKYEAQLEQAKEPRHDDR